MIEVIDRQVTGPTRQGLPAISPAHRRTDDRERRLSVADVGGPMLGDTEQVSFRIGQRGPLNVGNFIENVPPVHAAEIDDALDLASAQPPRHGEVEMHRLALWAGASERLKEHRQAARADCTQVHALASGHDRRPGDRRPERRE